MLRIDLVQFSLLKDLRTWLSLKNTGVHISELVVRLGCITFKMTISPVSQHI